jgi:nucleoid-associated protein YgaU
MPSARRTRQKEKANKSAVRQIPQKKSPAQKPLPKLTNERTFRWGESYTSLLLGIIVVIIGILFVVSLARTQHIKQVTSIATNIATQIPLHVSPTSPTKQITQPVAKTSLGAIGRQAPVTPTALPTQQPTPTTMPTPTPTVTPTNTPTPLPTVMPTQQPTAAPPATITPVHGQQTYTVQAGDDLWHIAEKFYHSGYNYLDIARANKLENPGLLYSGMKLTIPGNQQITPQPQTITPTATPTPLVTPSQQETVTHETPITANTYVVQKGDDLWNIALRAYNDGYRWTDIAKANNLANPGLIFSGDVLKIPR